MSVIYNTVDSVRPKEESGSNFTSKNDPAELATKDEFLKLFTAQLEYQNPMDPMKNEDFTAQLAQFSSLEQLTNINENLENTLKTNLHLNRSINNNMATTLIGKQLKVAGNSVEVTSGEASDLLFNLKEDTMNITLEIIDSEGKSVRNTTIDFMGKGSQSYNWDGKDNAGNVVEDGTYRFVVKGSNRDGEAVEINGFSTGVVTSVKYNGNSTSLICGGREYDISDVIEVLQNETETPEETETEEGTSDVTDDIVTI